MVKYKKENDGYTYFVVFIDIFNRYLYTVPLQTLIGQEMVEKPQILRTDQGSEYKNQNFNRVLNQNNIKLLYTYYETKANYTERVIKTIKNKIMKYLSEKETLRWVDILPDVTYGYNRLMHRSIKMSPKDAKSKNPYLVWKNQYDNLKYPRSYFTSKKQYQNPKIMQTLKPQRFKFEISDRVKISHLKICLIKNTLRNCLGKYSLSLIVS